MQASGGCLCGAVRFTVDEVEREHHVCHCGMCRRWGGGGPFFCASVKGVRFTDEAQLGRYASSSWGERGFCKACGSSLFYFFKPAGAYSMSVGAFDDVTGFRVAVEICIDRKPEGYALAGERPRWTEAEAFAQFDPSKS